MQHKVLNSTQTTQKFLTFYQRSLTIPMLNAVHKIALKALVIVTQTFNCLPNDKILNLSKFKAFAGDKIIMTQKLNIVLGRVENIVGKGENAGFSFCFGQDQTLLNDK